MLSPTGREISLAGEDARYRRCNGSHACYNSRGDDCSSYYCDPNDNTANGANHNTGARANYNSGEEDDRDDQCCSSHEVMYRSAPGHDLDICGLGALLFLNGASA